MAYLVDDENKKQEEQGQQGTEKVLATEAAPAAAPAQGAGQPAQANKPSKSGSFTNLMNYVGANQGQDAKMGQAVNNVVKTQADDATQKTQNFQSGANEQIKNATVQQDTQLQQNLVNDPTKVNKDRLNAQLNAKYEGPKQADEIQGFNDAAQAYNRVDDRVAQSQGDLNQRTGLLEEAYNRPTYTSGEKRLDSFILGTGQGGKDQLKNIQDTYGNFRSNLDNARGTVNQQIAQADATTQATRSAAQKSVADAQTRYQGILDSATKQAAEANAARKAKFETEKNRLSAIDNPDEVFNELEKLGFSYDDARVLYDTGRAQNVLSNYYAYGGDKTAADYVSPEQQAEYAALMDLMNGKSDFDFTRSAAPEEAYSRNTDAINKYLADANVTQARFADADRVQQAQRDAAKAEQQRIANEAIDKQRKEEQQRIDDRQRQIDANKGKNPGAVAAQENGNWFTDGVARWFGAS